MARDSPGTEILTRVVRSDWISSEMKFEVGMNTPYPAEVMKKGMFL
jgi:hypothetical protein